LETESVNEFVNYIWNEAIGDLKNLFEVDLNMFHLPIEEVKPYIYFSNF
jgi:hypothetical protein